MLLDYFDKRLKEVREKYKSNAVLTDVEKGVEDIRPLIGIENGDQISEKSVKEVGDITGRLIKTINSK